jgi:molybdopterin/thiamine biosynthesis adenylyltransferase/rhodanese-related sulfurtransferase
MTDFASKYYQSHSKLAFIVVNGQQKLTNASVLVIGAGGLGCPCLLNLAGCGIGTIGIADFDTVSVSNLHRQLLFTVGDVGKSKAEIAKQKLLQHNPLIAVNEHHLLVDESNVLSLIKQYDIVVDGTDNFAVRYLINDACVYLNKPLVYGAIYQTEGHVTVFNYHNSATLRCLFPEPSAETHLPSCAEVGAYNVVTTIIGTMMANEVVKLVLNNPEVLANKLVSYDTLSAEMHTIAYREDINSRDKSISRFRAESIIKDISVEDFLALDADSYQLIDVREDWEHDDFNIGGVQIALAKFKRYDFSAYHSSDKLILYCLQGLRSASAAEYLRESGFKNAVSLRGGLNAYLAEDKRVRIKD